MSILQHSTLAKLLALKPKYAAPAFATEPYLPPEIQDGDTVNVTFGTSALSSFPIPTSNNVLLKNGTPVSQGAAAVGGSVLQASQTILNDLGALTHTSSAITVIPKQTAHGRYLLGGNAGGFAKYSNNVFVNNGAHGGQYVDFGGGNGSGYHSSKDTNGYPTTGSTWWLTTPTSGTTLDGQLAHSIDPNTSAPLLPGNGVSGPLSAYQCTYVSSTAQSAGNVTTGGGVISNWAALGNNTYGFSLTVPGNGQNVSVSFSTAIQYFDIPRDGITPSAGKEFYAPNLANASFLGSLRLMDLCGANTSTETTWSTRIPDYGPDGAGGMSWERIARYINAVYTYPGSVCKTFWICFPIGADDTYISSCLTVVNNILLPGIVLFLEYANEIWNDSTAVHPLTYSATAAYKESWLVNNYGAISGVYPVVVSSVTTSGGVATVTLTKNITQFFKEDGTTNFITNGALCYAVNTTTASLNGSNTGAVTPAAGPMVQVAISTGGALAANQFSYPCATTAPATMTGTDQLAFFFNVNSTLVADQTSWNLSVWYEKWQTRRTYQIANIWKAVRSQDKIVLGLQQYGNLTPNGDNAHFTNASPFMIYGNWLGNGTQDTNGLKLWLDYCAIAPYCYPQCSVASWTTGSNVITNVPFAQYAVAGDSVYVSDGRNTTVVSGTGTTLTVADNALANATNNGTIYYGRIAGITGYISGTTLTVTALNLAKTYVCKGTPIYNNSSLVANTVVTGQLTGTAGGVGTYSVNNSQTLGSSGSPVSMAVGQADTEATLWALLLGGVGEAATYARNHYYKCASYGVIPCSYEGGPDTSFNFMKMVELWTWGQNGVPASPNITMGTCITALLDTWFSLGLDKFHYFVNAPQQKADTINAFGSSYSINQNFGDMNPAYSALMNYRTKQLNFNAAINSTAAPVQVANNSFNSSNAVQTSGAATGMAYWSSNAAARFVDVVVSVNRTGRYQLILKGSDNTNAGNVDVYLDFAATKLGTVTLPNNGNASLTTTVPGNSTTLLIPLINNGGHVIRFRMEAGVGGVAGIKEFTLQPY